MAIPDALPPSSAVLQSAAPQSEECSICGSLQDEQGNLAKAVNHAVRVNVPHYFHRSCIEGYVAARQAAQHPLTCPYQDSLITGIDGIPFAPPLQPEPIQNVDPNIVLIVHLNLLIQVINELHLVRHHFDQFFNVVIDNNLDQILALLANNNNPDNHRGIVLLAGARHGHLGIVQALLANGNIPENHRRLALAKASEAGHLDVVQELLANGNIDEVGRGWALIIASGAGHLAVVQMLLADGRILDDDRNAARHAAIENNHPEIANILKKKRSWTPIVAGATFATAAIAWIANQFLFAD